MVTFRQLLNKSGCFLYSIWSHWIDILTLHQLMARKVFVIWRARVRFPASLRWQKNIAVEPWRKQKLNTNSQLVSRAAESEIGSLTKFTTPAWEHEILCTKRWLHKCVFNFFASSMMCNSSSKSTMSKNERWIVRLTRF